MTYSILGSIGLVIFLGGILAAFWFGRPKADFHGPDPMTFFGVAFAGAAIMAAASTWQNGERAERCRESGGLYLAQEKACLPAELLKGRLP